MSPHTYRAEGKPDVFIHCLGRDLPEPFHAWVVVQGREIVYHGSTVEACSRWLIDQGYTLDAPRRCKARKGVKP
jgi:hypothetical protein